MNANTGLINLIGQLNQFYSKVDQWFNHYQDLYGQALKCRKGCSQCCQVNLSVFPVEAYLIATQTVGDRIFLPLNIGLDDFQQHRPTAKSFCHFLDQEGACTIYQSRPLICRTQGAILKWQAEEIELDCCPLNFADEYAHLFPLQRPQDWLDLDHLNKVLSAFELQFASLPLSTPSNLSQSTTTLASWIIQKAHNKERVELKTLQQYFNNLRIE